MRWVGDTQISEQTVEEAAETYIATLESRPNAWGRHRHPRYGDSHSVMYLMSSAFGRRTFENAVDEAFRIRRRQNGILPQITNAPDARRETNHG